MRFTAPTALAPWVVTLCALGSVLSSTTAGSAAAMCAYDLIESMEPYYVLGSLVTPQSSVATMAECGKTVDQVRAERDAKQAAREEEAQSLRSGRSRGDVIADNAILEALARARDDAFAAPAAGSTGITAANEPTGAAPFIDGTDLFVDWRQYVGKTVSLRGIAHMADSSSVFFDSGSARFILDLGNMDIETKRFFLKNCNQTSDDVPAACETTIAAVMKGMDYGMVHLGRAQVMAE